LKIITFVYNKQYFKIPIRVISDLIIFLKYLKYYNDMEKNFIYRLYKKKYYTPTVVARLYIVVKM